MATNIGPIPIHVGGSNIGNDAALNFVGGAYGTLNAGTDVSVYIAPSATTITALNANYGGTPVDGAIGRIRAGSSPYDFVDLRYDSTYAKWYSRTFLISQVGGYGNTSTGTNITYNLITSSTTTLIPWSNLDTAGLKIEGRIAAFLKSSSGANTTSLSLGFRGWNAGDNVATDATTNVTFYSGANEQTTVSTTSVLKDTSWTAAPTLTAKTWLEIGGAIKTSAGTWTIAGITTWLRWTS